MLRNAYQYKRHFLNLFYSVMNLKFLRLGNLSVK